MAKPQIMKGILESSKIDPVAISFDKSTDGAISVHTDSDSKIPDVADAASNLNEFLFGSKGKLEEKGDVRVPSSRLRYPILPLSRQ